jgi:hypothetical protein
MGRRRKYPDEFRRVGRSFVAARASVGAGLRSFLGHTLIAARIPTVVHS